MQMWNASSSNNVSPVRSWLCQSCNFLHLIAGLLVLCSAAEPLRTRRRCFEPSHIDNSNNTNATAVTEPSDLLAALQSTQCERCPKTTTTSSPSSFYKNIMNNPNNKDFLNDDDDNEDDQDDSIDNRPPHVVIFYTDDRWEYISLAAALLADNFTVTVMNFEDFTEVNDDTIQDEIASRMSCAHETLMRKEERLYLLNVSDVPIDMFFPFIDESLIDPSCRSTARHPFDFCTIRAASKNIHKIFFLLERESANGTPIPLPDVLVMDVTFVAGLLLSEISHVPTVAIASPHALDLAIEHDPQWNPNEEWNFLYRLYRILRQRMYSLSLTRSFLAMNAVRNRLGRALRILKTPIDYLDPVVAIILEDVPREAIPLRRRQQRTNTGDHPPQRPFITGSLQPPCMPCLPNEATTPCKSLKKNKPNTNQTNKKLPLIMIWPSPELSPVSTRAVIRGTIIARDSLASYDECEWDSLSCRNDAADFDILWLQVLADDEEEKDYFPEVVPSYVKKEQSVSLLDSLARHDNTIAVVAHCDSTSMALSNFGVSVLCVSQGDRGHPLERMPINEYNDEIDARQVAVQLLQLLREQNSHKESATATEQSLSSEQQVGLEGMVGALAVLRQVAESHRAHGPWTSLAQMKEVATLAARDALEIPYIKEDGEDDQGNIFFEEQHPYDTFTVLVAWVVVLSCTIYVLVKDFAVFAWLRPRRTPRGETFSDGLLSRMPDLDDAAAIFARWCKDQLTTTPARRVVLPTTARGGGGGDSNHDTNSNHHRAGGNPPGGQAQQNHNNHHHHNNNRTNTPNTRRRRRR